MAFTWNLSTDEPDIAADVERTGYFKSPNRDRVKAFHSEKKLTEDQVRTIVAEQALTAGALFRAVFCSGSNLPPRDGLTLAPSLQKALETTTEYDYFDWLIMINPAGELTVQNRN